MAQYVYSLNRVGKIVPPKRQILKDISLSFFPGAKIGLLGLNGSGKSSLIRIMAGVDKDIEGEAIPMPGIRIGYLPQEPQLDPAHTVRQSVEAGLGEIVSAKARLDEIYAAYAEPDADFDKLAEEQAKCEAILATAGADLDTQMEIAADALRLPPWDATIGKLSGGEKRRVALCQLLLSNPDMLLLDEPTNYLDLEGALWLEARLKKYPHTALIISHDREMLNEVCTHILHLANRTLTLYTGNYDQFEKARAEKARLQLSAKAKQDAERAHLQAFVDRFKAKASKAAQAQSRMKRLAKMEPVSTTIEERVAPFILPSPPRPLAPPLIRLEGANVGYEPGKPILRNLNLRMDLDDRIGLLGVNGAGKSTFAKMIAGALNVETGELHRDRKMRVGWFHQHQIEAMDPTDTPLEIIRRAMPDASESSRRSRLAQWGLAFEKQETTVASLSGGERARLLLNQVAMDAPHVLILDEPTNHLDLDSIAAVEAALTGYDGAVIVVSHDADFLDAIGIERTIELRPSG